MDFDFLFQNFEGVLSLTKRKAKILTFLSLAGLLVAVVLTVIFAFNIEKSKYIPGIIVLGSMMVLNVIFLIQGSYKSAVRVVFILPVAAYFLYINNYYAISSDEEALLGMELLVYAGFLYLFVFGYSLKLLLIYLGESLVLLMYFFVVKGNIDLLFSLKNKTVIGVDNPVLELFLVGGIFVLLYLFYNTLVEDTAIEHNTTKGRISEVMRQSDAGIMMLRIQRDKHGEKSGMKILRTNPVFDRTFKVNREELIGTDFSEIFPKLFRDSFNWQEVYYHSLQNKLQVYIDHLEQWFWINNISPEPDMIVASFVNISHLKQETNRLKIREQRLTSLMGSLPDIFFIIERDGTYVDYVSNNPELMKISQNDIIGKTIFEMGFSKPMSYQIYSSIQHVLEHDNIETIEYGMELPSEKTLIFEMRIARLNDSQIISIGRDITTKKEYERNLVEAKRKSEEAARLKASFLENISHEMRTPMNAIIGFSNLALNSKFNENEKRNFLNIVIENGENLMNIVTNVIDISEIETGTMSVKIQTCYLNELYEKIYEKYLKIISKLTVDLELEMSLGDAHPKFEIQTDAHLLAKILSHLIDNALKFTETGKVTFGYKRNGDNIKFFVKDTGIGINAEDSQAIYQQFYQSDHRVSRRFAGTGIGLTIVKNLTEILGGTIEFESEVGKGSQFYFYLPSNNYLKIVRD